MLASPNAMLVHLRREGNKLFDKPLPQLESDLAKLFEDLKQYGHVMAADLYLGRAKTDRQDAFINADTVRLL
ncbi:hypothetical protein AOT31_00270 [Corynebacterium ulcerans]|nr:Hypothetical protein CUL131002_0058 [Corynebacterium ulcerans]KPJ25316.1 hypothetical protein AOT31_00270 [Corynebacterium ulcerans]